MDRSWELRWGTTRLHASLPLAAGAAVLLLGDLQALLAYALIVAAHLGGHFFLAWRTRTPISGVQVHALGGSLALRAAAPLTRSLVGVGGVPGQLVLWLGVLILAGPLGLDTDGALYQGLTRLNLLLALLNALPIAGSDGTDLWALPARAEAQITAAQREKWSGLIDSDRTKTAIKAASAARTPSPAEATPAAVAQRLRARKLAEAQAELVARDARADAGIPDTVAAEADALLAEVWSTSSRP